MIIVDFYSFSSSTLNPKFPVCSMKSTSSSEQNSQILVNLIIFDVTMLQISFFGNTKYTW